MAIEATVVPADPPQVGGNPLDAIRKVGKPRVFVPTDAIEIGAGETLTVNGTLTINGDLDGSGVPSGMGAGRIGQLSDVEDTTYADNSILQYDSAQQQWMSRANDEFFDGSLDGGFPDTVHIDVLDIDGGVV